MQQELVWASGDGWLMKGAHVKLSLSFACAVHTGLSDFGGLDLSVVEATCR